MNKEEISAKIAELERMIADKNAYKDNNAKGTEGHDSNTEVFSDAYGLCLGGGGGKGAYQLGVYKALCEYGLWDKISHISGSSIGAINAVLFAGASPERSVEAWGKIDFETVFEIDENLMFDGKPGFMARNEMLSLMEKYVDYDAVREGNKDICVTISNYISEENKAPEYVCLNGLSNEDIDKLILASSALPVLYEPVNYNNKLYYDGGITDNIPVKPLYDNGLRHIIVCGLNPNSRKNLSAYKDADFIEIYPSVSLGDLVTGTLNFSANDTKFRMLLGYKDALRALKVYFEKDPAYISQLKHYEEIDLADIKTEMKIYNAQNSYDDNVKNIDRLLSGLGISNIEK